MSLETILETIVRVEGTWNVVVGTGRNAQRVAYSTDQAKAFRVAASFSYALRQENLPQKSVIRFLNEKCELIKDVVDEVMDMTYSMLCDSKSRELVDPDSISTLSYLGSLRSIQFGSRARPTPLYTNLDFDQAWCVSCALEEYLETLEESEEESESVPEVIDRIHQLLRDLKKAGTWYGFGSWPNTGYHITLTPQGIHRHKDIIGTPYELWNGNLLVRRFKTLGKAQKYIKAHKETTA